MRGLIDNSVNLGGEQTITGAKKFMQKKIDVDNIPDNTVWGEGLTFVDKNGVRIGKIEPLFRANGYVELVTSSQINNEKTSVSCRTKADGTRNIYASSPYVLNLNFAYGVVATNKTTGDKTVTFSSPLPTISGVVASYYNGGNPTANTPPLAVKSATTTGCVIRCGATEVSQIAYIAFA